MAKQEAKVQARAESSSGRPAGGPVRDEGRDEDGPESSDVGARRANVPSSSSGRLPAHAGDKRGGCVGAYPLAVDEGTALEMPGPGLGLPADPAVVSVHNPLKKFTP